MTKEELKKDIQDREENLQQDLEALEQSIKWVMQDFAELKKLKEELKHDIHS